jgi:hypothetical protein
MSKIFTSLFLTIATLLSGLVMYSPTINVSAVGTYSPVDCGGLVGRYVDANAQDRPCKPCPVDYYCKTLTRTDASGQVIADKLYKAPILFSPERPGKDNQLNSEVKPCPAGTTTKGNTYFIRGNTFDPILTDLNNDSNYPIKVGELAPDISFCKKPNFTCPAETPNVQIENDIFSCQIRCSGDQFLTVKNGVKVCEQPCRSGEFNVNSKCYVPCIDGTVLTIINGVVNCNDKCESSPIRGQVVGPKGNCVCPAGTQIIVDSNNSTGRCGNVIISSSSSVSSSSILVCKNEETLINGKCFPACPTGSTLTIINGVVSCTTNSSSVSSIPSSSSSSVSSVTPPTPCLIPGQIRSFGTCACPLPNYAVQDFNGSKSCKGCPIGDTVTQVGVEQTGEIIYKCDTPKPVENNNNGGGGICGGGFWDILCYGAGAYFLYDTFTCGGLITVVGCGSTPTTPAVSNPPTTPYGPVNDCYFYNNCPTTVDIENPIPTVSYEETCKYGNKVYVPKTGGFYGDYDCVCPSGTSEDASGNCVVKTNVNCKSGEIKTTDLNGNVTCVKKTTKPKGDCFGDCPTEDPFVLTINQDTFNNDSSFVDTNTSYNFSNQFINQDTFNNDSSFVDYNTSFDFSNQFSNQDTFNNNSSFVDTNTSFNLSAPSSNNLSGIGYSNEPVFNYTDPYNGTYFSGLNDQYSYKEDNNSQSNYSGFVWNF